MSEASICELNIAISLTVCYSVPFQFPTGCSNPFFAGSTTAETPRYATPSNETHSSIGHRLSLPPHAPWSYSYSLLCSAFSFPYASSFSFSSSSSFSSRCQMPLKTKDRLINKHLRRHCVHIKQLTHSHTHTHSHTYTQTHAQLQPAPSPHPSLSHAAAKELLTCLPQQSANSCQTSLPLPPLPQHSCIWLCPYHTPLPPLLLLISLRGCCEGRFVNYIQQFII